MAEAVLFNHRGGHEITERELALIRHLRMQGMRSESKHYPYPTKDNASSASWIYAARLPRALPSPWPCEARLISRSLWGWLAGIASSAAITSLLQVRS